MPHHHETRHLPYTPAELFTLVADIESYPEFIPWCRGARILARQGNVLEAELLIHFAPLSESYTSRVELHPPPAPHEEGRIHVELLRGPFHHLTNHWDFEPAPGGGTTLEFDLDFQFKSMMLEKMIGGLFAKATLKMVQAFEDRAKALYGTKNKE